MTKMRMIMVMTKEDEDDKAIVIEVGIEIIIIAVDHGERVNHHKSPRMEKFRSIIIVTLIIPKRGGRDIQLVAIAMEDQMGIDVDDKQTYSSIVLINSFNLSSKSVSSYKQQVVDNIDDSNNMGG